MIDAGENRKEIKDPGTAGLFALIGKKTITFYVNIKRGKKVRIGSFDEMAAEKTLLAAYLRNIRKKALNLKDEHIKSKSKVSKEIADMTLREYLDKHYYGIHQTRGNGVSVKIERAFESFMQMKFVDITRDDVLIWKRTYCKGESIKEVTLKNYATHLKRVYNLAIEDGRIDKNPFHGVKYKDDSEEIAFIFSDYQLEKLMAVAGTTSYRNITLIAIMVATGGRPIELLGTRIENINFKEKEIFVHASFSKTGESRYLQFADDVGELLKEYIEYERGNASDGWLFLNSYTGEKLLSFRTPWETIKRRAGIEEGRFYDLRHTFASKLIGDSVDIETVRDMMGHADISTTQKYIQSFSKNKKKAAKKIENSIDVKSHLKKNKGIIKKKPNNNTKKVREVKQIKLITLADFNPFNEKKHPFSAIKKIGKDEMPCMISSDILDGIFENYEDKGGKEIIRMIDRGQISQEDAKAVLGEKYSDYSSIVENDG